ncbi:response regulator transcription factor [Spirosoma aerophilum]
MATRFPHSHRILIAEENPHIASILVQALKAEYDITIATNGKDAIQHLIQDNRYDCVVTELNLPLLEGLELIRLIRSNELIGHTPILVLSAALDSNTRIACLEAGADSYLAKPFNPLEVKAKIDAIFRRIMIQSKETSPTFYPNTVTNYQRRGAWASRLRFNLF